MSWSNLIHSFSSFFKFSKICARIKNWICDNIEIHFQMSLKTDEAQKQPKVSPSGEWIYKKVLGSGTFGIVYSAIYKPTGKLYALKIQPVTTQHGITQSALMEMNIMSQIEHPNIMNSEKIFFETWKPIDLPFIDRPTIETIMFLTKTQKKETVDGQTKFVEIKDPIAKKESDIALSKPTLFIVIAMRKAHGETLRDIMGEHRQFQLSGECILDIFRKIFRAVAYMHSRGIMHCDLKPNNILMDIVETDEKLTILPVVADFGMSQLIKPEETSTNSKQKPMIQALPYQAPEVLCSVLAFSEETPAPSKETKAITSIPVLMSKSKKRRQKMEQKVENKKSVLPSKTGVYDEAVDIWSMGVIIIRILLDGRTPSDELDVKHAIKHFETYRSVVGSREEFMRWVTSDKDSFQDTLNWLSGPEEKIILSDLLEIARLCLTMNPTKRPSAEQILKMPPFTPRNKNLRNMTMDSSLFVDDDSYFANYRRHILTKFGCHSSTHEIANSIRKSFETSKNKPVITTRHQQLSIMAACCILAIKLNEPKLLINDRERYTTYNEAIAPFVLVSGSTQELLDAEILVISTIGFKIPFLRDKFSIYGVDKNEIQNREDQEDEKDRDDRENQDDQDDQDDQEDSEDQKNKKYNL